MRTSDYYQSITTCLYILVKRHGSLKKLSEATGISAGYLCKIRAGKAAKHLQTKTLKKLGITVHYALEDILEGEKK